MHVCFKNPFVLQSQPMKTANQRGSTEKSGTGGWRFPAVVFLILSVTACQGRSTAEDKEKRELIQSRVLIQNGQFSAAMEKLDRLIQKSSRWADEAGFEKVIIEIRNGRLEEALTRFRKIEGRIGRNIGFYDACLAFALESSDSGIREEYGNKFLQVKSLPDKLQPFKSPVCLQLSAIACTKNDVVKARQFLEMALSLDPDPAKKSQIEAQMRQLSLLGTPTPPIRAETWFHSAPLTPEMLGGKPVLVVFWAPWCAPCRQLIPTLVDLYERYGKEGLVVIGCTKLYGSFTDGIESFDRLSREEETSRIDRFIAGNKIVFPVALDAEGTDFDRFQVSAVPTLIWIDRSGFIRDIQTGTETPQAIGNKVTSFLRGE
jgi:thiol-disulfide isomerase/thioredoxin